MDIKELLAAIKDGFPDKAIDLSEGLELLRETINDTMDKINNEVSLAYSKRDFDVVRHFAAVGEEINCYEKKLDQLIELLEVDGTVDNFDEEVEKTTFPDYSAYLVDTNVEHSLYENFTHKRPFAFRINNQKVIEVKTWQEMLIKTCELLIPVNTEKFMSFEDKTTMNGKKRKYFSKQKSGMRNPKLVSNTIYVETNISSNGIRNLLLKLLKEYGFKSTDYKVYLKVDYTEIHS